jgi:hypothetical protein
MKTPNIETFIRNNRKAITAHILSRCPNIQSINDEERRLWILNDEILYLWAKREGVRV